MASEKRILKKSVKVTKNTTLLDSRILAKLKSNLLAKRKEVTTELRKNRRVESEKISEDDRPVKVHDSYVSQSRETILENTLRMVESALNKISIGRGPYGICEECGEPINPKRLEAVAWTNLCVTCQERKEASERRNKIEDPDWAEFSLP